MTILNENPYWNFWFFEKIFFDFFEKKQNFKIFFSMIKYFIYNYIYILRSEMFLYFRYSTPRALLETCASVSKRLVAWDSFEVGKKHKNSGFSPNCWIFELYHSDWFKFVNNRRTSSNFRLKKQKSSSGSETCPKMGS